MHSELQSKLGLDSAIIQAPMAGGPTTATLVAAVADAGALGSFGLAYSNPEQIHTQCKLFQEECARRALTADCGWNANFFVFPEVVMPEQSRVFAAKKALEPLARRVSVDTDALKADTQLPSLYEQVDAALQYRPSLVSFHLGIPPRDLISHIHSSNCLVAMSATNTDEALQVQSAGADFIVAQGIEAGGHRGVFEPEAEDKQQGITELVETLTKQCNVPVIASGGIMTGTDIVAIRACGADAVQMGSAFLTVDECGSRDVYRSAIDKMSDRDSGFTVGFSGRPARGIQNLFIDTLQDNDAVLPFPLQNSLTGSLRKAAGGVNDLELMSLWAGANYQAARNCSVAELIKELNREMAEAGAA